MYKLSIKITLNSPLVLPSSDKTEVTLNCMDYIPGSVFLGITAGALYDEENKDKTLDIFHNGKVRFGNAYISHDGENRTYPIPSVCYTEKGMNLTESVALHHKLETKDHSKVWKQVRSGYFLHRDGKIQLMDVKKDAALKTAYNSVRRSTKAEQMFLYEYMEKDQVFVAEIESENIAYLTDIATILCGAKGIKKHNIAKSKTSEFGNISIESKGINEYTPALLNVEGEEAVVYAESNLAFINDYGEYTFRPKALDLGFKNAEIDYEKSQLWFDKFHVRNGKRKTHDAERLVIKKGSVFVLRLKKEETKFGLEQETLKNGLGAHISEGYGKVIINPAFLENFKKDNISLYNAGSKKSNSETEEDTQTNETTHQFVKILRYRKSEVEKKQKTYTEVDELLKNTKFNGINSSQWSALRSLVYQAMLKEKPGEKLNELLFVGTDTHKHDVGFFKHPKRKQEWETAIDEIKDILGFIKNEHKKYEDSNTNISEDNIQKLLMLCIEKGKQK